MPTLDQLVSRAREWIVDVDLELENQLADFFRKAQRDLEDEHSWMRTESIHQFFTVKDTPTYARPSDWNTWMRAAVYVAEGDGSSYEIESSSDIARLDSHFNPLDRGKPRAIFAVPDADNFQIFPTPDDKSIKGNFHSAGNYQVNVPYRKRLPALTSGAGPDSSNWFTENLDWLMTFMVIERAMRFNRETQQKIAQWTFDAQRALNEAKRRDKKLRVLHVQRMGAHKDARARAIPFYRG